ncbi:hypothetical protein ACFPFV_00055 [Salinicoccus siamensis]|uniref:hypothetical protein n=1 Tax=Salinicoccus siamensis TaxID=381830 RepID=UPI003614F836
MSGGKKIRPTFTLLAGKLGDPNRFEDVLKAGASLELIHMASWCMMTSSTTVKCAEAKRRCTMNMAIFKP